MQGRGKVLGGVFNAGNGLHRVAVSPGPKTDFRGDIFVFLGNFLRCFHHHIAGHINEGAHADGGVDDPDDFKFHVGNLSAGSLSAGKSRLFGVVHILSNIRTFSGIGTGGGNGGEF